MKGLIIWLLVFVLLSGCKSLVNQSSAEYQIEAIGKNEFQKLNGVYKNYQDSVFGQIVHEPYRGKVENNLGLLDRLFVLLPDQGYRDSIAVEITFTSSKKAVIKAFQNDTIVFNKRISGKFKKGYFYSRPKGFIIPFFPIYYVHDFERVRLGKTGNNLIVDHTMGMWGFALFAGSSDYGRSTSIYEHKN